MHTARFNGHLYLRGCIQGWCVSRGVYTPNPEADTPLDPDADTPLHFEQNDSQRQV